jgi:hypothetical protein
VKVKGVKFTKGDEELAHPLLRPLYDDLIKCEELLSTEDTQFARRAFVRSSFAFIEGYIYWLKREVFKWLTNPDLKNDFVNINITAITLLQDTIFYPSKQGKIKQEPNRLPFLNFCAFVLRTAAEHWGMNPESMFSDNGWKELQLALKVRHRITHPKQPQDLAIADVELESVRESHRWLFNCVVDIANTAIDIQKKKAGRTYAG